jgi:hypothetical protein
MNVYRRTRNQATHARQADLRELASNSCQKMAFRLRYLRAFGFGLSKDRNGGVRFFCKGTGNSDWLRGFCRFGLQSVGIPHESWKKAGGR